MRAHLSINVRSVPESVAFYEKVFGQKPQKQTSGYAKFDLKEPALNFSMLEAGAGSEGRKANQVNHLGIEVSSAEDVASWAAKLEEAGVQVLSEEGSTCCYALQDKVWFQDPDGNNWEVFYVHAQLPIEAAQPPRAAAKEKQSCGPASGCC